MPDRKPLISISVPVLNEADNLENLRQRLLALAETMRERCDLEFVFTDNCSTDDTWELLRSFAEQNPQFRAIKFSKNVGFQKSILANFMHCRGDAVMQIDADLQDPPEMLEQFLDLWETGYDVIYGVRRNRQESAALNISRKLGYRAINFVSQHDVPLDAGDFRLMDRKVIQALMRYRFVKPYIRGTVAGLGFNAIGVPYDRDARTAGVSKFNSAHLVNLGLEAVFEHSRWPLKFGSYVGLSALLLSTLGAIYYLFLKLLNDSIPEGLASIHILVLFGIGLNAFLLGIIGEYIQRIYILSRAEPMAVSQDSLNIPNDELKL